jgi:hypothetical protein
MLDQDRVVVAALVLAGLVLAAGTSRTFGIGGAVALAADAGPLAAGERSDGGASPSTGRTVT